MTFAEQFKAKREKLNLSQTQAGEVLGVSKSVVGKWETGNRTPLKITQTGIWVRLEQYAQSCGKKLGYLKGNKVAVPGELWRMNGLTYLVGARCAVSISGRDDLIFWENDAISTQKGAEFWAENLGQLITVPHKGGSPKRNAKHSL